MTPEELSKLPHYDYYTNMKAAHPDASDQLCRAFADAMNGYLYGTQEALDAFAWFWKGWAASSGARMRAQPEAASTTNVLEVAEETISKSMSWIGGRICSGPEQEERKAGMAEECRAALALIRALKVAQSPQAPKDPSA